MKTKKRKKSSRLRGSHTQSKGFKKKARGKGHRGGKGMAGTGKRADHRKSLILNLPGKNYFGKSKRLGMPQSIKLKSINLAQISQNLSSMEKKGTAKKTSKGYEILLPRYKLLSNGDLKLKLIVTVPEASKNAVEKVKSQGGEVILPESVSE